MVLWLLARPPLWCLVAAPRGAALCRQGCTALLLCILHQRSTRGGDSDAVDARLGVLAGDDHKREASAADAYLLHILSIDGNADGCCVLEVGAAQYKGAPWLASVVVEFKSWL